MHLNCLMKVNMNGTRLLKIHYYILKLFGFVVCNICLLGDNKICSIGDISREKFGLMTTNHLLELRMLSKAKSGYSRGINTSGRCNRAHRFACINQKKNSVF